MSSVNLHPPQTYSRLFRPWDSKSSDEDSSSDCSSSVVKQENISCESPVSSSNNQSIYEDVPQSEQHGAFPASSPISSYTYENAQFAPGLPSVSDLYQYPSGLPLPSAPYVGMDPFSMSLMEQEYARVMAEDAHLKALNSRKQRPKKFKCPHCDVAFSNNGQLKGHIRIHTGERPFKCDVETCGKTFTRNEELTRHKRIHTGLRPYACTSCGKKFGRRDHLKKHMKTHLPQERQLGPAIFVPMYPYLYGY
ncbi:zinc finger protein 586 [Eupeodes corollae]|uniref:zinc finger protein 586 n=1 Tax=Eupeodes corollae TaxID=290404 RepID=UPI002493A143|nr:zinc finger protein 586 [Eupeodes corollae]